MPNWNKHGNGWKRESLTVKEEKLGRKQDTNKLVEKKAVERKVVVGMRVVVRVGEETVVGKAGKSEF